MKLRTAIALAALLSAPASADEYVKPHFTKDGKYVEGYYRTSPNNTTLDNYSTKGNTNPYTGKPGTRDDGLFQPYKYTPQKNTWDYEPYSYEKPKVKRSY